MQQIIRTGRMLEAEWWQLCREAWVWGHLGCWISSCYGLFYLGTHFENYEPFISLIFQNFFGLWLTADGACSGIVVKALCYKPAGHGFNSRWCHWNF